MEHKQVEQEVVEQHEQCEKKLQACELLKDQLTQRIAYMTADLENMRRRAEQERLVAYSRAQGEVIKKILPVIDDFDRAFSLSLSPELSAHLSGFELVYKTFKKILVDLGVQEVETVIFDPELHEAVMQVPHSGKESGAIVTVFEKGYQLKGTVIRPAKVSVAV